MQKGRAESVQHPPKDSLIEGRSRSLQPGVGGQPNKPKATLLYGGGKNGSGKETPGGNVSGNSSENSSVPPPTKRNHTLVPSGSPPTSPYHPNKRYNGRAPTQNLPARRDSSIGATSTNPKLRKTSVFEVAAANRRTPVRDRVEINLTEPENKAALKVLKRLLKPIIIRRILRRRRLKKFKVYPPRQYTTESVVAALRSERSQLSEWPVALLEQIAEEVNFSYYHPNEILVYAKESHLSSGLVVLLHGHVTEERGHPKKPTTPGGSRAIKAQKIRPRHAPDALCVQSVLCEDTNPTCIRSSEAVDVAIISSRWLWSVVNNFMLESSRAKELLALFNRTILPNRVEMMLSSFYGTSILLQRSWMWPFLSGSDRVKLARSMEVKVINIGDVLFEEGMDCPYIYFLRRGTLTVVVKGEPLSIVEPGSAFGELSAIFNEPRNSSVVSGSICELYALHQNEIHHRFQKYPDLAKLITFKALERRRKWMEDGVRRDIFSLVSIISGVPCLSHTTESMREELANLAEIKTVPPGFLLVNQNTPCKELYVIGRGFVRVGGKVDPYRPNACVPLEGESRSAGDYFGELFLRPHLWPYDVVSETSVDVWVLNAETVLKVLESNKVNIQAAEVCRQGISLYRVQHGENSIVEGYGAPAATGVNGSATGSRRGSTFRPAGSASLSGSGKRQSLTSAKGLPSSPLSDSGSAASAASLAAFDWVSFVKSKNSELEKVGDDLFRSQQRELREVDKATEKMLKKKVQSLISVPLALGSNPADCDFPGEVNELQATIVEQLLLTPTEDQPRFLRQVNDSNVRLIVEDGEGEEEQIPLELLPEVELTPGNEVSAVNVSELEEIASENSDVTATLDNTEKSISLPFQNFPLYNESSLAGTESFANISYAASGPRRSLVPDESGNPLFNTAPRGSISRSHFVRPPSGIPGASGILSPRQTQVGGGSSPRGSVVRPISASDQLVSGLRVARPVSVDYSQQGKITTERSTSVLDRFVKIEDENYFNSFVKVLPLEQDELWIPDDTEEEKSDKSPHMLLLVHVRVCGGAVEKKLDRTKKYVVKVQKGEHLILLTSAAGMQLPDKGGDAAISWPIDKASFIKFVRKSATLLFSLLTDTVGSRAVYEGNLEASVIEDEGGITQYKVPLFEPGAMSETTKPDLFLSTVCMSVAGADYMYLKHRIDARHSVVASLPDADGSALSNTGVSVSLHIVAVKGLKHRIDASMVVYFKSEEEEDVAEGKILLKTPHVAPKTRNPYWPADGAFIQLKRLGFVRFELQHKNQSIGSYRTSVNELVFGGMGIQELALSAPQLKESLGTLVVNVLSASTVTKAENDRFEKAVLLQIKKVKLLDPYSFIIPPDLFVVIRNTDGDIILRTPLALGEDVAIYDIFDASCLLSCPLLEGSKSSYLMELCDNDLSSVLSSKTINVMNDGLGPNNHYLIELDNVATVEIFTQCFPIVDMQRCGNELAKPSDTRFNKADPLTVLNVVSCDMSGLWEMAGGLALDPIAVVTCEGEECMRTPPLFRVLPPKNKGATGDDENSRSNNKWQMEDASVTFRVNPKNVTESRGLTVSLYNGTITAPSKLGQINLPLADLCRSGLHTYDLFWKEGRRSSTNSTDRKCGSITLRMLSGRVDCCVAPPGGNMVDSKVAASTTIDMGEVPFYETALLAPRFRSVHDVETIQLRFTLSNVCNILPDVISKTVKVIFSVKGTEVFSAHKKSVTEGDAHWDLDDASTLVVIEQFPLTVHVQVTASDVLTDAETPMNSAPDVLSVTQRASSPNMKKGILVGQNVFDIEAIEQNGGRMFVIPVSKEGPTPAVTLQGCEAEAKFLPPFSSNQQPSVSLFVKRKGKSDRSI